MSKLLLRLTIYAFCVGVTEHEAGAGNNCDIKDQDFKTHKPTEAIVGDNVTLPCVPSTFSINIEDDIISWTKGVEDIYIIKEKRVSSIKKGLKGRIPDNISEMEKNGHASISLINLTKTDGGDYCCCIELMKLGSKDMKCINHTLDVRDENTGNDGLYATKNESSKDTPPPNGTLTPLWIFLGILGVLGGVVALIIFIHRKVKKDKIQNREQKDNRRKTHPVETSEEDLPMQKTKDSNRRDTRGISESDVLLKSSAEENRQCKSMTGTSEGLSGITIG